MSGQPSKRQLAVALRYQDDRESAPRVIAKGRGPIAEKIISLARDNEIPTHPDPDLATVLERLDVGEMIPPELYTVVAEVLAYIYSMNRKTG